MSHIIKTVHEEIALNIINVFFFYYYISTDEKGPNTSH